MRALLQRVTEAEVKVEDQQIGATGAGLLILICAMAGDTQAEADQLISKITKLRIFKDDGQDEQIHHGLRRFRLGR